MSIKNTHHRDQICFSCGSSNGTDGDFATGKVRPWLGRFQAGSYNAQVKSHRFICESCMWNAARLLAGLPDQLRNHLVRTALKWPGR